MQSVQEKTTPSTRLGAWIVNVGKHLSMVAPNDLALEEVENLLFAGKCGALLVKLSSDATGEVTEKQVKAFARVCAIGGVELPAYLQALELAQCVSSAKKTGTVEVLALSRRRVLESTAKLFDSRNPTAVEASIPNLLEYCLARPRLVSEAHAMLRTSLSETDAKRAVSLARRFRLLEYVEPDSARKEHGEGVLYNGYQFGDKARALARAMNAIKAPERQQLDDLLGRVKGTAGILAENAGVGEEIVRLAVGLGMVEMSEVASPIGSARFLTMPTFSAPSVGSDNTQLEDDVFHHAKMLLTSFRFGELKSTWGRRYNQKLWMKR